jgi:hypothetical protein
MLPLCRLVYMPIRRFVGQISSVIESVRQELYIEPYHEINWQKTRSMCAKVGLWHYGCKRMWL